MSKGWIALHRKIWDNFLWQEKRKFSKAEAWIDLLLSAQHSREPSEVVLGMKVFVCKYGQCLKSLETWAKRWDWSPSKARRFLILLKNRKMIEYKNEKKTIRITICNYATYQQQRNVNETQNNTETKSKRNGYETDVKTDNNVGNNATMRKRDDFPSRTFSLNDFVVAAPHVGLTEQQAKKCFEFYETQGFCFSGSGFPIQKPEDALNRWKRNLQSFVKEKSESRKKLFPITGKTCSKSGCRMPAVYKDSSGNYDFYYCAEHMPESVKAVYS